MADDSIIPSSLTAPGSTIGNVLGVGSSTGNNGDGNQSITQFMAQINAIINFGQSNGQVSAGKTTPSLMGRGLQSSSFSNVNVLANWTGRFPYRLLALVVDQSATGGYRQLAEYTLPINPQDLVATTPFAIKTTVTSRGILEEHNGFPLKQFSIRSTTGFYQTRPQAQSTGNPSILGSIFAGTIAAAQTVASQFGQLTSIINPTTPADNPAVNSDYVNTGYFQFHLLRLFLETYAEAKTKPGNQGLRLALEINKDQALYLVTPQVFSNPRSANSPMEYPYSIQLLAWGTVPKWGFSTATNQVVGKLTNTPNDFQRALNALRQLRQTVNAAQNVVGAVRADIQTNILGPINQTILLLKDIASIPSTIADFPSTLRKSLQNSVIANWTGLVAQLRSNNPALTTPGPGADQPPGAPMLTADLINSMNTAVQQMQNENTGSNELTGPANTSFIPSVLDNINLTDSIQISQLTLTPAQSIAVNNAHDTALNTTNNDINNLITNLQGMTTALEPSISQLDPLDPLWDILYNTADTVMNLYGLMADGSLLTSQNANSDGDEAANIATSALAFWQQTASANEIPFATPVGKFSVPFPMGATLEQLAFTYLNDATRWPEIVALNGLQYPYIDQDGFVYAFINNGNNNQFAVASGANLYVGQKIFLSSSTQITSARTLTRIVELTSGDFLVNVDGDSNLSDFTTADHAQVMAYLPYTVNAMSQIYIPSAILPAPSEVNSTPITFIDDDPNLVRFSRIDWLLDSNFDLAVSQNGFQNLAYGKTNLIQAATLKVRTKQGTVPLDPSYGLPIGVGDSIADVNTQNTVDSIITLYGADERFLTPNYVNVTLQSGVAMVQLVVPVAQGQNTLPITIPLFI